MKTLTCEVCSSSFQVPNYREKTARFCSKKCGGAWHLSTRKMPNTHKVGNKWRKGMRPANAFTSEQVKTLNAVQGKTHDCAQCKKPFEVKPWLERQNKTKSGLRFCCKSCHGKFMANNKSGEKSPFYVGGITTYRGKGWEIARENAVKRDAGTCQRCSIFIGASIPVHHKKPFRLFKTAATANKLSNLVCLCQSCHMIVENS